MADEIEDTFDKLKAGAKDKESGKENSTGYERTTGSGTSDPSRLRRYPNTRPQLREPK